MKRVLHSVRVALDHWYTDDRFDGFLTWLRRNADVIDQVALFTTRFHPPMPLETAKDHCEVAAKRIAAIKVLGISCGVNVLSTVGHHPEKLGDTLKGDWTYMTNLQGEVCLGSRCMNNPAYLEEYVRPLYEIHCAAKPDFIWVDDDIRYGHIPIGTACFCDRCIATFNEKFGYRFDRATLAEALRDPDAPAGRAVRHNWLTHQSDKIVGILRFIREVVNSCDDRITLGFMTGDRLQEGYDFAAWADALSDGGKYEIMWRPGGGAYTDTPFEDQLNKTTETGRQSAYLPEYVTSVQSELENCPYELLKKSPRSTALEGILHLTTGCNGTAWNILTNPDCEEPLSLIDPHFEAIRAASPFMRLLSETLDRSPTVGIHNGWHIHIQASAPGPMTDNWPGEYLWHTKELFSLGLPESFDARATNCYALSGRAPYAYSREELLKVLSGGVYLNGGALNALRDLGLGEYVGFRVGAEFPIDAGEVYCDHPLNEGFVGHKRVCSPIFCRGQSFSLEPTAVGTETLCRLVDYKDRPIAACSMGLFRNSLGGRICAASYFPWSDLSDSQKSTQMKRVMRFLAGSSLPAYVASYHRIRTVARMTDRGLAVTFFNRNLDRLIGVRVKVAGNLPSATLYDESCRKAVLSPTLYENGMTEFEISSIDPYSVCLLTAF